jgi:hypothetical protein
VAIVALGLHVKEMTDSGFAVAALWICLFGPSVAVAGLAGCWSTGSRRRGCSPPSRRSGRWPLRRCLQRRPCVGADPHRRGRRGLRHLVSGRVLAGAAAGRRGRIQEANGHIETARYLGFGAGPLLGGLLFAAGGLELAMLVDAATFAFVAIAALALRVRRRRRRSRRPSGTARPRRHRLPLPRPAVGLVMTVAFASLLFMSAVWVGELFFVEDVLGRGDVVLRRDALDLDRRHGARARCCSRAGSPPALSRQRGWSPRRRRVERSPCPRSGSASPSSSPAPSSAALAHGLKNVMFRSLIHVRVPDDLHGRAFAAYNASATRPSWAPSPPAACSSPRSALAARLPTPAGSPALAGIVGVLALLRMYRGWVPTGPVGPPTDAAGGSGEPPGPGQTAPGADDAAQAR